MPGGVGHLQEQLLVDVCQAGLEGSLVQGAEGTELAEGAQNTGLSSLAGLEEPGNLFTEPGSGQTLS